jgi:hypothetical protein
VRIVDVIPVKNRLPTVDKHGLYINVHPLSASKLKKFTRVLSGASIEPS